MHVAIWQGIHACTLALRNAAFGGPRYRKLDSSILAFATPLLLATCTTFGLSIFSFRTYRLQILQKEIVWGQNSLLEPKTLIQILGRHRSENSSDPSQSNARRTASDPPVCTECLDSLMLLLCSPFYCLRATSLGSTRPRDQHRPLADVEKLLMES